MASTPLSGNDPPPSTEIELLADLDARIAGDAPTAAPRTAPSASSRVAPERVDLLLQLHELGAAWREDAGAERGGRPTRIDRFEIVREVGQGGFATVYEATDTLLHRRVALKVAHPEALVSPALRRRFLREAEVAARAVHPNLVAIHDLGETRGLTFIAEEFCSGGTLAGWLDRHPGPVEPRLAAAIVKALAEGLEAAHARGIVHRDIKPENILLAAAAAQPTIPPDAGDPVPHAAGWDVKLGDFGLGKVDDDSTPDPLSRITRTSAAIGTPAWMAPEQVDRTIGPIGPATDVHALGLLLDRLLVGRCRWKGNTDSETMRLILLRDGDGLERAPAGVPRDLAAVCRMCLDKDPAARYPRAGELAADLSRFLLGVPTRARPLSVWERACRFAIRRPALTGSMAAALLASLLCGVALWGWSIQSAAVARERDQVRRFGAAQHLQLGLDDLRAGNVAAARERLVGSAVLDPTLTESFAGRWARRRLRCEQAVLFGDPIAAATERGDLYCAAVSADGRRLAAGSADGRLILLDADGGRAALVIDHAHDEINDVAFAPDGRRVATAGQDGRVCLWSAAGGALLQEVAREPKALFAVCWSPDGTHLAWGGEARILSVAGGDGTLVGRFPVPLPVEPGTEGPDIETAAFVDDDTILLAGGPGVMFVSARDGSVVRRFAGHEGSVVSVDLSPDGSRLATAGTDRVPRIWNVADGSLHIELPPHPQWVQGCVFTADGTRIVTGCRDGMLQVFDATDGTLMHRLPGHVGRNWDIRREPSGTVLSVGADGTLRRFVPRQASTVAGGREWALPTGRIHTALPVGDPGTLAAGTAPPVVVVPTTGCPLIVDAVDGRTLRTLLPPIGAPTPVTFAALDARHDALVLCEAGGRQHVVPLGAGTPIEKRLQNRFERLAWTVSGRRIGAEYGASTTIHGRDEQGGAEVEIDRFDTPCDVLEVAPDGRRVVAGGSHELRLTPIARRGVPRPAGPTRLLPVDPLFGNVFALAWSPDGTRLAVGSKEGNVRILDAESGDTLRILPGHRSVVTSLVWSADGRILVSADDESVCLSDTATALAIDNYSPGWSIRSARFVGPAATPDRWLVIGGDAAAPLPSADGTPGRGRLLVIDLGQ